MSVGKRRSKISRAHLRPASPVDIPQAGVARKRSRLFCQVCLVASIVLATAIVHGTGTPFTYRLGQRPAREIRVNVAQFKREDPLKTNADRRAREAELDPIVTNAPAALRELEEQLDDLIDAVAKAVSREYLPENLAAAWNLDRQSFEEIKTATDTPERREQLHRLVATAFAPLIANGVLGSEAIPRDEEMHPSVRVRMVDNADKLPIRVPRDRIVPERIVKPDGPVAKDFIKVFTSQRLGQILFSLVADKLASTPTLTYDEAATVHDREMAVAKVPKAIRTYRKGDVLVAQDELIATEHLELLRLEHSAANAAFPVLARLKRAGAVLVLVAALFALIGYYVTRSEPRIASDFRRIASLCILVVSALAIMRLLATQPWDAELIPITLASMILALAYSPRFALVVGFGLSLLTTLSMGTGIAHFMVLMGGTSAAVLLLGDVRTRTKPIQVGAVGAVVFFVLTWATGLVQNQPTGLILADSLWRSGWGLMAGFFLGGSLPFIEKTFGIVTGISLLELGDITHPLLQELVRRAPGTHNHSVTVGTIAEAAAEKIGANALLVRIGAYFHDIGKMLKPHYFVENLAGGANRHSSLNPAMSTLIIIGHVKDGIDLAHQHHLPEPIVGLIEQHHGTTLVEYFYREAARRSDGDPDAPTAQESAYRYPGPKPQTKEAGILMVADAVESAGRTLSDPTPARIDGLVSELIQKRLDDGQFDECGLTLREIAEIRESLIKSLIGIYHGRIKYPEQRTA